MPTKTAADLWIQNFHPAPLAACRLVCLPHAGGSATFYHPLSRALSPAVEVLAVQYPGRQHRRAEPCIEDLGELADRICESLADYADRPLALFGHSMGALLAFEVALQLERATPGVVAHVFASARSAPSVPGAEGLPDRDDAALLSHLRELGGTQLKLLGETELLPLILPALRSDYRAVSRYRHRAGERLRCGLTGLAGAADPAVGVDAVRAWRDHTAGPFDLRVLPGGHFYLDAQWSAVVGLVLDRLAVTLTRPPLPPLPARPAVASPALPPPAVPAPARAG
jgi:surfactin synthase thioesterase subunit